MAYLVAIGNRAGGSPTINVREKPKPTLECFCRAVPKILESILEVICIALTGSGCAPDIAHYHSMSVEDKTVYAQVDKTRTYISHAAFGLGIIFSYLIIIGYVLEGVRYMTRHETIMLFMCGGLSIIAGGLILDAVINHPLYHCENVAPAAAAGVLQIVTSIIYFVDCFIASQTKSPTTSLSAVQPQGHHAVHLPAKV